MVIDRNLACAQSSGSSAPHASAWGAVGLGPPGTPYCMLLPSPRGVVVAYGTLKPGLHPGRYHTLGWGILFLLAFQSKYPCVAHFVCPVTALVGSQPTWSEKGESFEMQKHLFSTKVWWSVAGNLNFFGHSDYLPSRSRPGFRTLDGLVNSI